MSGMKRTRAVRSNRSAAFRTILTPALVLAAAALVACTGIHATHAHSRDLEAAGLSQFEIGVEHLERALQQGPDNREHIGSLDRVRSRASTSYVDAARESFGTGYIT